jgi:glucose-6-phosphate 1-dehydrogenase
MVIFGASGDLTARKLMPALYNLAAQRALPVSFKVVGAARAGGSDQTFRTEMRQAVTRHSRTSPVNEMVWNSFEEHLSYASIGDPDGYEKLRRRLDEFDKEAGTSGNRLFYLAVPPTAYAGIVGELGRHAVARSEKGWSRIVIEKPFGRDLASARSLSEAVQRVFREHEIFRIDHYLGKETVQNILVLRFANGIFEPTWNRQYIDHVQITVAESGGIEARSDYYESAGALRDIVQNHLLQLLTLVAMEPPVAFDADAVRDEKVKVLRAVRRYGPEVAAGSAVLAQYAAGYIEGQSVRPYLEEPGVARDSSTDTYVALKVFVDNWRWEGTPFYVRTGKRLPKRATEIAIQYRRAPHQLFGQQSAALDPNVLVLRLQPDEGVSLRFGAKVPVQGLRIRPVNMDFGYGTSFVVDAPDAYETLLLDALEGDATLFTRRDEIEEQWEIVDPILAAFAGREVLTYESGSWGPDAADRLIERDGRAWRRP